MSVERLRTISLNPFFASKILQSFLTGYNDTLEFKILFYVLPIVMYKEARDRLIKANSASRINTVFGKKHQYNDTDIKMSGKAIFSGFIERFDIFNELTKQSIIVLAEEEKIQLKERIELLIKIDYKGYPNDIKGYLRAAYYLGVIMSKNSIEYFEHFLGVHSA